jgi:hypothetical protein
MKTIAQLEAEIMVKRRDLDTVRGDLSRYMGRMPPLLPRSEIVERVIPELVQKTGAAWLRGQQAEALIRGPQALASPGTEPKVLSWGSGAIPWGVTCAAAPDEAIRFLTALIKAIPFEEGPPSAERPALIARLQGALAELEVEEERLVDEAQAAGSSILHRREVQERRFLAGRDVSNAAVRRQREAEIDARQPQFRSRLIDLDRVRGRVAYAPYLTSGREES